MADQKTQTNEKTQTSESRENTAPEPEDPRKPDEVSDIRKPSWVYIVKKTGREFSDDQATDIAATLTYYAVLAVFPALLAFVSLIGLFGDAGPTTGSLLDLAAGLVPESTLDAIRGTIEDLASSPASGWTFVIGVVGALWSASGYVAAFSRAMNRIYEIDEGRPFWKLRPVTLGVTVLAVVVAVVAAVIVVASGRLAEQLGEAIGVGDAVLLVWDFVALDPPCVPRGADRRGALSRDAEREAAQVPVDEPGSIRRTRHLGRRQRRIRVLRVELRKLQRHLRRDRRHHRLPPLGLDL